MLRPLNGKHPQVHPSAFVSEAAYVVGDVAIGPNSSVWPNATIRADNGYIRIGSNTNIQDNCVLHADADADYGDDITMGHSVVSHAKRIASHVLIGNSAILNDGVEIGEWSVIAAGAVVLENTKIPPGSIVMGVPAQVKGQTQERHRELIRYTVGEYLKKVPIYKASGKLES
jgi:carbonic anhydrase/acetyltransferase-like protein (isoleucine patch superfamily)